MKRPFFTLFVFFIFIFSASALHTKNRSFFYMGDGKITIGRGYNGVLSEIKFRDDGGYIENGLKKINKLYGSDYASQESRISLRLIELLDHLEDELDGGGIRIISGYRDPDHNQALRDRGKLAASSSLHLDAEAVDIVMEGVPSSKIYNYLLKKNCCGIGYYHGKTIHIDDGPPRFWDEKTSGTEKKEPPENEHIILKTKSDLYRSGEKIGLKFSRVTDYPIGVKSEMELSCKEGESTYTKQFSPEFEPTVRAVGKDCYVLKNRREGRTITMSMPTGIPKKGVASCVIKTSFCEPKTAKMPYGVVSNPFIVNK